MFELHGNAARVQISTWNAIEGGHVSEDLCSLLQCGLQLAKGQRPERQAAAS